MVEFYAKYVLQLRSYVKKFSRGNFDRFNKPTAIYSNITHHNINVSSYVSKYHSIECK